MTVRVFPERFDWEAKSHLEHKWPYPMAQCPGLTKREQGKIKHQYSPLPVFLIECTVYCSTHSSLHLPCSNGPHSQTLLVSKPQFISLPFASYFVNVTRKIIHRSIQALIIYSLRPFLHFQHLETTALHSDVFFFF